MDETFAIQLKKQDYATIVEAWIRYLDTLTNDGRKDIFHRLNERFCLACGSRGNGYDCVCMRDC